MPAAREASRRVEVLVQRANSAVESGKHQIKNFKIHRPKPVNCAKGSNNQQNSPTTCCSCICAGKSEMPRVFTAQAAGRKCLRKDDLIPTLLTVLRKVETETPLFCVI